MTLPLQVPVLLFGPFGATELLIILGIVILIFGSTKLPQLGAGLGQGIRNFRQSMKQITAPAEDSDSGESGKD